MQLGVTTTEQTDKTFKPGFIGFEDVRKKAQEYTTSLPGISDSDLYSNLLTVSWCGQRLGRWPTAKDAKTSLADINNLFDGLIKSYGGEEILEAISLIPDFDSRIVQQQIDNLQTSINKRIKNSPLFIEFNRHYPHIDLELLEKTYTMCRDNFVESGVKLLRREFAENPPEEFAGHPTWKSSYHQHLPTYLQQWQKNLKSMQNRMKVAQRAWETSTS